ncbi:MAG TPA: hypothetical protein DEO86_04505 [Colwellia sp.]|nr:hypothetical protein [Colwellia sp.]|tara:strand:+ start:66 stop:395 length:330 start_codon:yes stop_codon:yes gene_type:complete
MELNIKPINIALRIATVNHVIFLALMYFPINNCDNSPYGCSPEKGLSEALFYLLVFGLLAIVEGIMLLGIAASIIDKSLLKVSQLNAFVFLVTFVVSTYTLLDFYYASM